MPIKGLKQRPRRKKLVRFAEVESMKNVFVLGKDDEKIKSLFNRKITLELGCGKGDYTIGLARLYPNRFFIGVDRKGERIWRGAKIALEEKLDNVIFLRGGVERVLEISPNNSVEEIWITFPDPFPRRKQAKHRLTNSNFLEKYKRVLVADGTIKLKTDDYSLFSFTAEAVRQTSGKIIQKIEDIYANPVSNPELSIQTSFEKKHLASERRIYYLNAVLFDKKEEAF